MVVPILSTLAARRPPTGSRRTRAWIHMDTLLRDVVSTARRLAAQRGLTLAVLLALALGIGANTAMFSVVHALLLRPLPYPDPERIVRVGESSSARRGMLTNRSMPLLQDAEAFEHLAAYREVSQQWAGPDGPVTLRGAAVSPALFPLLRATPHLGRLFTEGEAREGADGVVLLSHRAWTNHFASDPGIVGPSWLSTAILTPWSACCPRVSISRTPTASSGHPSSFRRSRRRRPRTRGNRA